MSDLMRTEEDWIERIVWDAVWNNGDPKDDVECSWDHALEYEAEFGPMVPQTVRAAGEIRARFDELVRRVTEAEHALDRIWQIGIDADPEDPAFSPMGALETITDIASDFGHEEAHAD